MSPAATPPGPTPQPAAAVTPGPPPPQLTPEEQEHARFLWRREEISKSVIGHLAAAVLVEARAIDVSMIAPLADDAVHIAEALIFRLDMAMPKPAPTAPGKSRA